MTTLGATLAIGPAENQLPRRDKRPMKLSRTVFLGDARVPRLAVTLKHGFAVRPVRETRPKGAADVPQSCIQLDLSHNVEAQEAVYEEQRIFREDIHE